MTDLNLPDPLICTDGTAVKSAQDWSYKRRPELLDLFSEHMFGKMPEDPGPIHVDVIDKDIAMEGRATRKMIQFTFWGNFGTFKFKMALFTPNRIKDRCPVFLLLNSEDWNIIDPDRNIRSEEWPVEMVIDRGYAIAAIRFQDVSPDISPALNSNINQYKQGLINAVYGKSPLPKNGFRSIASWAWAGSRAIDYLENDINIDRSKIAIIGHSRGGKTALWCGANDPRIALTISNQSGCSGAALSRRKKGELLKDINIRFPHWFCENYHSYNGKEDDLPFDQHELVALLAPRLVYIGSSIEDEWDLGLQASCRTCVLKINQAALAVVYNSSLVT